MEIYGVNIVTMLLCALATMILGSLWYGPLFGKQWMKLAGIKMGKMDAKAKAKMRNSYIIMIVSSLLTALILGILVRATTLYGAFSGAALGALIWLGFVGTVTIGSVTWEGKPWRLWFLNSSYNLLNLMIIGAIMGAWG